MNEILHFASYYTFCFEPIALATRLHCKNGRQEWEFFA